MSRPRIGLTQSRGRLEELGLLLEARGFETVRRPLIETVIRVDERTRAAASALASLPWLLLTSRASVTALVELGVDLSKPRIGVLGPATAAAVQAAGGRVNALAAPHSAEGLARTFLGQPDAAGPVGVARGNRALDTLERILGEASVVTHSVTVYDTFPRPWEGGRVDAIVLASPSAVEALPDDVAGSAHLVTLGATTSAAVRARGWACEEAERPTPEATLAAVERVLV